MYLQQNDKHSDEEDDDLPSRPRSLEIRPYGRGTNPLYGTRGIGSDGYMRPRCNTEIMLEKMKREKKNAPPKVKTVHWKDPVPTKPKENHAIDELEKLFPGKEICT